MAVVLVDESALDGDESESGIVGTRPGLDTESASGQLQVMNPNYTNSDVFFVLVGSPQGNHGFLTFADDGSFTYDLLSPLNDQFFEGAQGRDIAFAADQFQYEVYELGVEFGGPIESGFIDIDIRDDISIAVDDLETVDGGGTVTGNVLSNDIGGADGLGFVTGARLANGNLDSPPDGGFGTPIVGMYGTLTFDDNGDFSYTAFDDLPAGTYQDVFAYGIQDAFQDLDTGGIFITVRVDAPPLMANDDFVTGEQDFVSSYPVSLLLENDDPGFISDVFNAVNGEATLVGTSGEVRFFPTPGFIGIASFEYTLTNDGRSDTALVTIDVQRAAVRLLAVDDLFDGTEDEALPIFTDDLLLNDIFLPPSDLSSPITFIGNPTNGTLSLEGDIVTFIPDPDFNGLATFEYTITDPTGASDTALVTIDFATVNDPPVAEDDSFDGIEDEPIFIAFSELLANDSDPDDDDTIVVVDAFNATGGTLSIGEDGVEFTPDPDFNGEATFEYEIEDSAGASDTATVTIDFVSVNDPPTLQGLRILLVTPPQRTATPDIEDRDGDPIALTTTQPRNGTASVDGAAGTITVAPDPGFTGVDDITVTASDGEASASLGVTLLFLSRPDVAAPVETLFLG